jgi:hypothetical protein
MLSGLLGGARGPAKPAVPSGPLAEGGADGLPGIAGLGGLDDSLPATFGTGPRAAKSGGAKGSKKKKGGRVTPKSGRPPGHG